MVISTSVTFVASGTFITFVAFITFISVISLGEEWLTCFAMFIASFAMFIASFCIHTILLDLWLLLLFSLLIWFILYFVDHIQDELLALLEELFGVLYHLDTLFPAVAHNILFFPSSKHHEQVINHPLAILGWHSHLSIQKLFKPVLLGWTDRALG